MPTTDRLTRPTCKARSEPRPESTCRVWSEPQCWPTCRAWSEPRSDLVRSESRPDLPGEAPTDPEPRSSVTASCRPQRGPEARLMRLWRAFENRRPPWWQNALMAHTLMAHTVMARPRTHLDGKNPEPPSRQREALTMTFLRQAYLPRRAYLWWVHLPPRALPSTMHNQAEREGEAQAQR